MFPAQIGLALWAVTCCAVGACGTALARRYALHRQLIDLPGARRSHAVATPRGGGIAIVAVMLVALVAVAVMLPSQGFITIAAAVGLLLVAGVGWIDDHRPLSALPRLAAHAIAAVLLAIAVYRATGSTVLASIAFALAIGLVNVWNFMDGINGLAASQAALAAAAYAVVADDPASRWLCIALMSACLGFLPFNFPTARIFLGDVGSGALGYLLAVLAMMVASGAGAESAQPPRTSTTLLLLLALPLSAFLIDAGLTLGRRMLRGERWWMPHVQHAYQRWAASAGDHRPVTRAYLAWSCIASSVMLGTWNLHGAGIIVAVSAWYLGGGIVWAWLQSRHRIVDKAGSA